MRACMCFAAYMQQIYIQLELLVHESSAVNYTCVQRRQTGTFPKRKDVKGPRRPSHLSTDGSEAPLRQLHVIETCQQWNTPLAV
jgi:hypothetical protein